VCPICEKERKPQDGFLSKIGAPARRALEREGIHSLEQLVQKTEKELLSLHGVGPNAFKKLKQVVEENGMSFKIQS
jgi:DNA-directed RNA polymerase alpha subunit